jgi:7,8-dihydropterin-6-yl-methyl-4-(beta-D-ribofuranosyl)aminobenzene 5'-phosphate synthase
MLSTQEIKIRIIVDNTAAEGLSAEHGFAAWIEAGEEKILFDTGKEEAFMRNCEALGIDLATTTMLVLSHGHYDHAGGVSEALALAGRAKVVLQPDAFTDRWSIRAGVAKPTMMPARSKAALLALPPERIVMTSGPAMVADGIGVTGSVPRLTTFEDPGGPFFLDTEEHLPDPILDDMSLWIETTDGLVVATGCCHSGIVNTLEHIISFTGERRITMLLGGFHLSTASAERMERTIDALTGYDIRRLVPCHCTGNEAAGLFRRRLPFEVTGCHAGLVL